MIPAENKYETYDGELLAIFEAFKTSKYYLEGSQHEVLMLTDHNNLRQFMDTKSLSSRQVCWAQELSRYYSQIDYCQGKANGTADALYWYLQRNAEEGIAFWAENIKILYCLQFPLSNASFSGLSTSAELSQLHRVVIYETYVLPQFQQFWSNIQTDIAWDSPYITNIGGMKQRLSELQEKDKEARHLRGSVGLPEDWEDVEGVL